MTDTAPAPAPLDPRAQEYELVPIDSIEPHPDNPNKGYGESIEELGFYGALVCQRSRRRILVGHTRWRADKAAGETEIPVIFVDCDDVRARKIMLADNEWARKATTDQDLLALNLQALLEEDGDLTGTGYDTTDLELLLEELGAADGEDGDGPDGDWLEDPDETPEVAAKPLSSFGDVWLLGAHRVVCGDSTTAAAYEQLFKVGDESGDRETAQLVWTDPPYGVSYVGKTADALTIENDELTAEELEEFLGLAFGHAAAACDPGAGWFVAAEAGPRFLAFGGPLNRMGIWRQTLVWAKDVFVMGRSDYHYKHEAIFYGWKPGAAHHEPPDRTGHTLWEFARPKRSTEHPTMKPVDLIARAVTNHTDRGQVVLDPFGGSGSTLMAAHGCGRAARLIEKDPRYVDVIVQRWAAATGKDPVREGDGQSWAELKESGTKS